MSKINKNTQLHIDFFIEAGVTSFDIAARTPSSDGKDLMQERKEVSADKLPNYLPWLKRENKHGTEIQIRPHRHGFNNLLFFDDVKPTLALAIAKKYSACVIQTSEEGGCHVWLQINKPLDERQRFLAQRYLQSFIKSDKGSISGEHYGRLAGFVNHKRSTQQDLVWVNVIAVSHVGAWYVSDEAVREHEQTSRSIGYATASRIRTPKNIITGTAASESEREWGYICGKLEHGAEPEMLIEELVKRATIRGKRKPIAYAQKTVEKALRHTGRQ